MNRIDIKQDYSCGFTPKCCACKYFSNLDDFEDEIPFEKSGYCYNVKTLSKYGYHIPESHIKAGRTYVWHMTHACFYYEYRGEDLLSLI